jgi:hypothetical protein
VQVIRHMVMLNLKPEVEDAERQRLFARIRRLSEIGSVRRLAIGELLHPRDVEYRKRINTEFRYALLIDFADEAGLETYQRDPYHVEVGQEIRKCASELKVTDFVTTE